MVNIMFGLAGLSLVVGVLIGAGLHIRAVDRRYRRVARLVRQLRVQQEALAEERALLERRRSLTRNR